MRNFSEGGNNEAYDQLYCLAEGLAGIRNELICLSVVNIFLSFTVFLGNALIQIALHKETSLHPPLRLLLRTLSVSDLCVGLVSEPLVIANWLSVVKEHWGICRYAPGAGENT